MKRQIQFISRGALILTVLVGLVAFSVSARGIRVAERQSSDGKEKPSEDTATSAEAEANASADVTIEPSTEPESVHKEVSWLGLSTTEASEALASQLDLEPGVGLVVTYVAPESPAAKSGLRKNDVLTKFDDQALVHPAQLRKLVRVHPEGTVVKLAFYRGGKRETASVTLGKTKTESGLWEDEQHALKGNFKDFQKQLRDLHVDETVRDQMRLLRESLGNIKIDQKEVQEDIRRGMEQAGKAIREAMRNATNAAALNPLRSVLESLAHSGVVVDDKADVVVRSSGKKVKSMVKSDDSGTIVLLSNPRLHLTAHDKDGKLLFDGPIETSEDRAKVPPELWQRVEPVVDQMRPAAEQPEDKDGQ
jgi:membrane-associated protease RseP (regulator of RpoE activity)